MFDKLQAIENRFEEINMKLSDPEVVSDNNLYRSLMKEHSELTDIVDKYKEYKKLKQDMNDAKEMLNEKHDKEMHELIEAEFNEARDNLEIVQHELKILLMPKDPNDDKNVIVEIRGGAGGEEAALFAYVLFRMYSRYAERKFWSTDILDLNETEIGGFKEVVFSIEGKGAFSRLKYESGVHSVQRVP